MEKLSSCQSTKIFPVPVELLFTEDWRVTGAHVESTTPAWLEHNSIYSGTSIGRLWPHQRLFEYFRQGFNVEQLSYVKWHQDNFRLRDLQPPFNDHDLLVFRFEQFRKWNEILDTEGVKSPEFTLPVRFDEKANRWMLVDGHHRSAFLRTSGVRHVQVTAIGKDWETWHHLAGVEAVHSVIDAQRRTEFYTPILHPEFQALKPLRDFAYKSRLDYIVEFLGPRCRSGTLVDIGSNGGFFAHHFMREGFNVVGFDPDPNHHALATALSMLYRLPATFEDVPFQDASNNHRFDGALLLTVLYHFLEKQEHRPLLAKLDALVEHFVIWESGSRPDDEKRQICDHTKFIHYVKIANTYGTGRMRELGIFCTKDFFDQTLRTNRGEHLPMSVNHSKPIDPADEAPRSFMEANSLSSKLIRPDAKERQSVKSIFEYMGTGQWLYEGNQESVSGPGSTISYTNRFRAKLEEFLEVSMCRSLLDAPCGDFNWMRAVRAPLNMRYFGADIVESIIEKNREAYGSKDRLFFCIDLIHDAIPDADVWLCRDCLFHLSFEHALRVLRNGLRANIKYYMLTSHFNDVNTDDVTGSFRPVNLCRAPFNLPEPIASFTDYVDDFPPRRVGVWTRDQIMTGLMSDPS
ncbi:methyltransferase domain-containing protein [Methylorubrum extorquens]